MLSAIGETATHTVKTRSNFSRRERMSLFRKNPSRTQAVAEYQGVARSRADSIQQRHSHQIPRAEGDYHAPVESASSVSATGIRSQRELIIFLHEMKDVMMVVTYKLNGKNICLAYEV